MKDRSNKVGIGRGAAYLYIETITSMISGYFFWFILSKITTSAIIGTSSVIISLAGIFSTIASLGVQGGAQRFLGKSLAEERLEDSKEYIKTSLLVLSIGITACSIVVLIFKSWLFKSFDFDITLLSILIIGTSNISSLFRAIVISSINTKILPLVSIVSTATKLALAIGLVLIGAGVFGVTFGYMSYFLILTILLALPIAAIFKQTKGRPQISFGHYFKNIFTSSMVTWIPGSIATIGSQLGPIVIIGVQGASQAGYYFIAFSIFTAIFTLMSVLSGISYPALSAMYDGRKKFSWRMIRINSVVVIPLSSSLLFYSKEIMGLFGREYSNGSSSLEILLLSMLPTAVMSGVSQLVYSYGNYKQTLIIGIITNLSRTILYFTLVPIFYGGVGAALSYTIGTIIGFAISVLISKKIGMLIFWKELILVFCIPTGVAFILSFFGINYILGVVSVLIISYVLYIRFKVLTRSDMEDIIKILPSNIANPVLKIFNTIGNKVDRSF